MPQPRPDAERPAPTSDVFDHVRREDGEHVGYIEMTDDGRFVPYDLLWVRRGEPMELEQAEEVLDAIGLRLLADDWLLLGTDGDGTDSGDGADAAWSRVRVREVHRDHVVVARATDETSAHVAKAVRLGDTINLPLPTPRLRPVGR